MQWNFKEISTLLEKLATSFKGKEKLLSKINALISKGEHENKFRKKLTSKKSPEKHDNIKSDETEKKQNVHLNNHIKHETAVMDKWDFGIQTDHLISARRPDLIIINKKKKKKERKSAKLSTLLSRQTTE